MERFVPWRGGRRTTATGPWRPTTRSGRRVASAATTRLRASVGQGGGRPLRNPRLYHPVKIGGLPLHRRRRCAPRPTWTSCATRSSISSSASTRCPRRWRSLQGGSATDRLSRRASPAMTGARLGPRGRASCARTGPVVLRAVTRRRHDLLDHGPGPHGAASAAWRVTEQARPNSVARDLRRLTHARPEPGWPGEAAGRPRRRGPPPLAAPPEAAAPPSISWLQRRRGSELTAMRMVSKTMNPGSNPGSPAQTLTSPASQIFAPDALAGRVVLVTGGGTNLGLQAAIELAAAGARASSSPAAARKCSRRRPPSIGERCTIVAGDIREPDDARADRRDGAASATAASTCSSTTPAASTSCPPRTSRRRAGGPSGGSTSRAR